MTLIALCTIIFMAGILFGKELKNYSFLQSLKSWGCAYAGRWRVVGRIERNLLK